MSDLKPPSQNRPGRGARSLAYGDDTGRRAGSYLHGFKAIIHSLAFAIRRWFGPEPLHRRVSP